MGPFDDEIRGLHSADHEFLQANAGTVLASLIGVPAIAVRMLAEALEMSTSPLRRFAPAFTSAADAIEREDHRMRLATLRLGHAMRNLADGVSCEDVLERLEGATEAPWPALREALCAVRDRPRPPAVAAITAGTLSQPAAARPAARPAKAPGMTTTERGYGWAHQRERARLAPRVERGGVECWRCGDLIVPGSPWDLGHDDLDRSVYRGPEHVDCNRAAGAAKGNAMRPRRMGGGW